MRYFKNKVVVILKWMIFLSILSFASVVLGGENNLLTQANQIFTPLPQLMLSEKNPVTPGKVNLGKILFYETRISVDGTVSCARCHPIGLYAADGLKKSIGNHCKVNPRNAPTLFNAARQISAHWIGNRADVEDQAKQSVIGPPSFGMPSYEAVEKILKETKGYMDLFKKAFPQDKDPISVDNFAKAIGAFERTLVTPSPFDSFLKGNKKALTEDQQRGLNTFIQMGCITCHSGTYIGGQMYQKFGIFEPYWKYTKSEKIDEGRYDVTKNESDKYLFKVPILRNVAKTAPYFHDGSVDKLIEAVLIMGKIQLGRNISEQQGEDLVKFLTSLTGEIRVDVLIVPILPSKE
jgi:cytochrome c peroxidase